MTHRPGTLWLLALGITLALAGAAFTAMLWRSYQRAQETRAWVETPCRIISSVIKPERATPHSPVKFRVTVRYDYGHGGRGFTSEQVQRGEGSMSSEADALALREQFTPGQQTTCWVDPTAPATAVLRHGTRAALYSLWFPLLFVFGGAGMAWRAVRTGR